MVNIEVIEDTIEELENGELSLEDCRYLASLYVIKKELIAHPDTNSFNEEWQTMISNYIMSRDLLDLNKLLSSISDTLSELFHTSHSKEERREFEEFMIRINSMLSPTRID